MYKFCYQSKHQLHHYSLQTFIKIDIYNISDFLVHILDKTQKNNLKTRPLIYILKNRKKIYKILYFMLFYS